MSRDEFWRIEHAFSDSVDTATPTDGHIGAEQTTAPGASYTLGIWITEASDSPTGAWPTATERYETLRAVGGPASATVVHPHPGDGADSYTTVGATSGVGGGLVTIHPPAGSQHAHGGHYACTGVSDGTTLAESLTTLEFELVELADLGTGPGEYPDRETARQSLESPI